MVRSLSRGPFGVRARSARGSFGVRSGSVRGACGVRSESVRDPKPPQPKKNRNPGVVEGGAVAPPSQRPIRLRFSGAKISWSQNFRNAVKAGRLIQTARKISNGRKIARIAPIWTKICQSRSQRPKLSFEKVFRAVLLQKTCFRNFFRAIRGLNNLP